MHHALRLEATTVSIEDANVGFWVSRAPLNLTYVRLGWALVHDVKCTERDGASFPARVPTPWQALRQAPVVSSVGRARGYGQSESERASGTEAATTTNVEGEAQRQPEGSIVVHKLKTARGLRYVWRVLSGAAPHDPTGCRQALTPSK